ncbi:hypothetical Protein psc1_01880 [Candidatus Phytoplasma solani]
MVLIICVCSHFCSSIVFQDFLVKIFLILLLIGMFSIIDNKKIIDSKIL